MVATAPVFTILELEGLCEEEFGDLGLTVLFVLHSLAELAAAAI
jgi:hypothetical protein